MQESRSNLRIMISTRYYLDCRDVKEGHPATLKIVITKNRVRAFIPTSVRLLSEKWNANEQKARGEEYLSLNVKLGQRMANLRTFLFDLETKGELAELSASEIKDIVIKRLYERDKPKDNSFLARFNAYKESRNAVKTKSVYQYTLNLITSFMKGKIEKLRFEDIDIKWLREFDVYLSKTSTAKNARNIHFRNIRAVFNDALDDEVISCYPFRKFKIKAEPTKKRALSLANLRKVFDYPVEEYAEIYRDMFKLIFLLIGINTIDLHRLKGITPEGRIEFLRAKTTREYSIKVEPEAMAIIDKYRGKNGLLCIADRWKDHVNFRHQMNTALQNMGTPVISVHGKKDKKKKGEFPELSTYWARHTWATIARQIGVSKDDIRLALGHGAKTVTDIYIDEDRDKIDIANRRVIDYVIYGK